MKLAGQNHNDFFFEKKNFNVIFNEIFGRKSPVDPKNGVSGGYPSCKG